MKAIILLAVQLTAMLALLKFVPATERFRPSPRTSAAVVLSFCAVLAAYLFLISEPLRLFTDFKRAYYPAGAAVLSDPQALAPFISKGVSGFVNLPVVAYIFAPLALLPVNAAAVVFFLLGVVATFLAWRLLVQEADLDERQKWLLLVLFAANGPLANTLKEGNTSHFILLALVVGYRCLRTERRIAAGIVLAICALIKLPFLIFGPYFLIRGMWKSVLGFSVTLAVAGALSLLIFGLELNVQWFQLCVLKFGSEPLGAFNVQSIPGFLVRLFSVPEVLTDWNSASVSTAQRMAGSIINALVVLAAAWAIIRSSPPQSSLPRARERLTLEYCLVLMLAVIASPLAWSHYYVWLLIPIAFFLSGRSFIADSPTAHRAAWIATIIVSQAILYFTFANPVAAFVYEKFAVSSLLIGGLIWYAILLAACWNWEEKPATLAQLEGAS